LTTGVDAQLEGDPDEAVTVAEMELQEASLVH